MAAAAAPAQARVRFPQLKLLKKPPDLSSDVATRLGPLLSKIGPLRHAAILEALLAAVDSPARATQVRTGLFEPGPSLDIAGVRVNAENFRIFVEGRMEFGQDLVAQSEAVVEACRYMRTAAREACVYQPPGDSRSRYANEEKYREEHKIRGNFAVREVPAKERKMQTEFYPGTTPSATWVHGTLAGVPVITGARVSAFNFKDDHDKNGNPYNKLTASAWANMATSDTVLRTCIRVAAGSPDGVSARLRVKRGKDAMGEFKETNARMDPKTMAEAWEDLDESELGEIPVAVVMQILLTSCSRGQNQLMLHERQHDVPTWPNRLKLFPAVDRWTFCRTIPFNNGSNKTTTDYGRPGVLVLTERVELKIGDGFQVTRFANAAALALLRLHGQCFCHNNIVPWSFARAGDDAVLCDFAFIRPFTRGPPPSNPPSFDDEFRIPVPGAHDYCAPESLRGVFDTRSDVYMLGRTLYALITGLAPVAGAELNYVAIGNTIGHNGLAEWILMSQFENPEERPSLAILVLIVRELAMDTAISAGVGTNVMPLRDGVPGPDDRAVLWDRSHMRHSLGAVFNQDVGVHKDGTGTKGRKKAVKVDSDQDGEEKEKAKPAKKKPRPDEEEKAGPAKKKKPEKEKEKAEPAKKKKPEKEKEKAEPAKKKKRGDDEKKQDSPPAKRAVITLDGDEPVAGPAEPAVPPVGVNTDLDQDGFDWRTWANADMDQFVFDVGGDAMVPAFQDDQPVASYNGKEEAVVQAAPLVHPVPGAAQLLVPVAASAPAVQQDLLPPHPPQHLEPNPVPAPAAVEEKEVAEAAPVPPASQPRRSGGKDLMHIQMMSRMAEALGVYDKTGSSQDDDEEDDESDEDGTEEQEPPVPAAAPQALPDQPGPPPAPVAPQVPPSPVIRLGQDLNPMGDADI